MKKKIRIGIFISEVGFGHMVRQVEIIKKFFEIFKNISITIFTNKNVPILKKKFFNYKNEKDIKYFNNFNNIKIFTDKNGSLIKGKTIRFNKTWDLRAQRSKYRYQKILRNFDILISDFVPEIFYYAKLYKKLSFGICHYTWNWFFDNLSNTLKNQTFLMKKYTALADKLYFPPITPPQVFDKIRNYKNVNFIISKSKIDLNKNFRTTINTFLIMDNGTGVLSRLISKTIPYIVNSKYFFYIGITHSSQETLKMITNSENLVLINKDLNTMYSYIPKVDYVIARAGFNTITECLLLKKPALLMDEINNPEISANLKYVTKHGFCNKITKKDWGKNFLLTIKKFLKNSDQIIDKLNLQKNRFKSNGAHQIVTDIKNIYYSR
jgi:uncharacterized protein (TIGR00661 family)